MNVANKELCQELYELSGWEKTTLVYQKSSPLLAEYFQPKSDDWEAPAYDLGYLLRKLPNRIDFADEPGSLFTSSRENGWQASYLAFTAEGDDAYRALIAEIADTPEDATCKLAIELFKAGELLADVGA